MHLQVALTGALDRLAESLMDLHPWQLWTADGKPGPGNEEIVVTLETVMAAADRLTVTCSVPTGRDWT